MQDVDFKLFKTSLTMFARICELFSKSGEDPFQQKIERHYALARVDSNEKLDRMLRCVESFEKVCRIFEDAGVDTSESEFIDYEVYIVSIDTKIWDLSCYISLEMSRGYSLVNFGIVDHDGGLETAIYLNDNEDGWVLHSIMNKHQTTLLLPLLNELGLVDCEERAFSDNDLERTIRVIGQHIARLRSTPCERHIDNDLS